MKISTLSCLTAILGLASSVGPMAHAGQATARAFTPATMPPGAKLYVAPMEWQLDSFIQQEVHSSGLPVQLVTSQADADFVMTGSSASIGSHLISPGHYFQVKVVTADVGAPVWSVEASDYATFFARLRSHGPKRAAKTVVSQMRKRFYR